MAKCLFSLFYFFHWLLPLVMAQLQQQQQQQRPVSGPWRHRIQWENNGQVYSLLSTGSEFQAPVRSRTQSQVYMTGRGDGTRGAATRAQRGATYGHVAEVGVRTNLRGESDSAAPGTGRAPRARQPPEAANRAAASQGASINTIDASESESAAAAATQRRSADTGPGSGQQPLRAVPGATSDRSSGVPAAVGETEAADAPPALGEDAVVNDDPRNPFKNHRNSVFYNMYPGRGRSAARTQRPPAAGHGTRYFQNGLPDLVPDPYAIQAGAYVQRMQMYALRCAAEENCLSRSAYGPAVRDIDFRVLLRFPQRVKNQGTGDFLPVKPRYQWDWHSCHQHYHSMDAFSNYDLLDATTGRKVAEGHKASFCLEDTGCETGFRRRYACTSHTQGLSPGCHDLYAANIDCQWIDITDVPPGNYILKVTVNPNFHVLESDFTNNIVRCDVIYTGVYVQTRNCRVARG